MATADMEDDIYDCSICLTDMMDRNPRSLPCLHCFCEDCLVRLVNNNTIICPTCRKTTELTQKGVKELPVNFMLVKMRDRDLNKAKQAGEKEDLSKTTCQVCKVKDPRFKCKDCPRLMCTSCRKAHSGIEEYKDHSVFDLCLKHEDHITHVCMECIEPLCMSCMVVDHSHHKKHFKEFTIASENLQRDADTLEDTVSSESFQIFSQLEKIEILRQTNIETKLSLQEQRKYYVDKVQEVENLLKKTENTEKILDKIQEEFSDRNDACHVLVESLKALNKDMFGFCKKYKQLKEKAEDCVNSVKKILYTEYDTPLIVLNEHVPMELVKSMEPLYLTATMPSKDIKLKELVVDLHLIKGRYQFACLRSDVVLPSDKEPYHILRLNQDGGLVSKYYSSLKGEVIWGVSVYKDNIYIVQDKEISVISTRTKKKIKVYKPNIETMDKILVKDETTIYISDYKKPGNIYRYDTRNNQTTIMVQNLCYPSYISQSLSGNKYIVTETWAHCLSVFDENWKLLQTIGRYGSGDNHFNHPRATVVTPMDTLLIADEYNNRICHYTLDGKLLSNIITIPEPHGLAFRYPYLWMCSWGKYVRCFEVK